MRLKLKNLRQVVDGVLGEEKSLDVLRSEVRRVLGPIMDTDVGLKELAEAVNYRLDVMDRTGRDYAFNPKIIANFMNHNDSSVRKLAARTLPEQFLKQLTSDKSPAVRAAVARRLPTPIVKEMMSSFPNDEELRLIYSRRVNVPKRRNLTEEVEEEFDIYGEEAMGDDSKTYVVELSDLWYRTKASELLRDYRFDDMIDMNWEERAVSAFCEHLKATSGVEIDKKKLFDTIQELVKEKEERILAVTDVNRYELRESFDIVPVADGTFQVVDQTGVVVDSGFESEGDAALAVSNITDEMNSHYDQLARSETQGRHDAPANDWKPKVEVNLKGLANMLMEQADREATIMPVFTEDADPVADLVRKGRPGEAFIQKAMSVFSIQESTVPGAIKKYVLGEGTKTQKVPVKARLPKGGAIRPFDEKALDMFVESWNNRQASEGEPYKLYWDADPCDENSICFSLILR